MYCKSIDKEEINKLQRAAFEGKIIIIDHLGKEFDKAIDYLFSQKVIGFDTETRPCFSAHQPHHGVSLVQLSGADKAYLFRINKTGFDKRLAKLLADENVIKVGAAIHDDLRGLRKYHEFKPGACVDLQKIVWEYGIKDKSVKKMAAIILERRISKAQQLSNWEAEKLTEAQQLYAATDAWVCLEMYSRLLKSEKHPLTPEEMMPPEQLRAIQERKEAKQVATKTSKKRVAKSVRKITTKRKSKSATKKKKKITKRNDKSNT